MTAIGRAHLMHMLALPAKTGCITELLEQAVVTVRTLSPDVQDDLARVLLQFAGTEQPVIELIDGEYASFDRSFEQADRGEFATDKLMSAVWTRHVS